jgi:hypothetical protein
VNEPYHTKGSWNKTTNRSSHAKFLLKERTSGVKPSREL